MPHATSPSSGLTLPNRYTVPTPSPMLRQAQEDPEVKRAYAEYLEVQRKYAAALQAAISKEAKSREQRAGSGGKPAQPEDRGQRTEVSGKAAGSSNQVSVISKQLPVSGGPKTGK